MSSFMMVGFLEMMMLMGGGGILGMPPGPVDPALLKSAPEKTLMYMEWSARGKGKAGAPGIDGLVADPEIVAFYESVKTAILNTIEGETANASPTERALAENIPPLVLTLLNQPGCLYITFDAAAAQKAIQEQGGELGPGAAALGVQATLILSGGTQADEIAKRLDVLLEMLPAELKAEGMQNQTIPLPLPGAEKKLTLHREGNYFILGFGEGTVKQAVAGLAGNVDGLVKNEKFQATLAKVKMVRQGGLAYLDLAGVIQSVAEAMGPAGQMVTASAQLIGADAIQSITSSSGVVDGQIHTKTFVKTNGKTENLLSVAAGRKLTPKDFAHIPADADLVNALSINPSAILEAVQTIINKADPESGEIFAEDLKQIEQEFGLTLKEIFAAFGDVWTLYDSPSAGGVLFTSPVLTLEVNNGAQAKIVFEKLMKLLQATLPGEYGNSRYRRRSVNLVTRKFLGQEIYFMNTIGDDIPFAPAFCVTDQHLLVSIHPQALKAHLRFLADKGESFSGKIGKTVRLPEGDQICLSYTDSSTAVRLLYALAPYFGQVIASELQSEGVKLDVFSLPSARAILPYLKDAQSTITRTPDGILLEGQKALPIPGVNGSAIMALPAMFLGMSVGTYRAVEEMPAFEKAAPRPIRIQVAPVEKAPIEDAPVEEKVEKKAVPPRKAEAVEKP